MLTADERSNLKIAADLVKTRRPAIERLLTAYGQSPAPDGPGLVLQLGKIEALAKDKDQFAADVEAYLQCSSFMGLGGVFAGIGSMVDKYQTEPATFGSVLSDLFGSQPGSGGNTAEQLALMQAQQAEADRRRNMLLIGGGIALAIIIVIVILITRKK